MSETYPQKKPLRNTFRRTYFPPAQDSGAKVQYFFRSCKLKSLFLHFGGESKDRKHSIGIRK